MSRFSPRLGSLLCCPTCGTAIAFDGDAPAPGASRWELTCGQCSRGYSVEDGILCLLREGSLVGESAHERAVRDEQAPAARSLARDWEEHDEAMEMGPTLKLLDLGTNDTILELGCGDGRFTEVMASPGRRILAVDFSKVPLRRLGGTLRSRTLDDTVGLVCASVTDLKVKPRSFDVVFSTLTSNLPSLEQRQVMYRLAAEALKPGGRFVFSAHHQGLRRHYHRVPKAGHYSNGIFRYNFGVRELRRELAGTFRSCRIIPFKIYLPVLSRRESTLLLVSQIAERIPVLNWFADLLLCEARDPRP